MDILVILVILLVVYVCGSWSRNVVYGLRLTMAVLVVLLILRMPGVLTL